MSTTNTELLYACNYCGRMGFTLRGLTAHVCRAFAVPSRLSPKEIADITHLPFPMPKTIPKKSVSNTELVIAGQPGAALCAKLKHAGANVTVDQLSDAVIALEQSQAKFVTEVIAVGLMIEAKKQTLKHGEFQRFAAEVWEIRAKWQRAATLPNGQHVSHLEDRQRVSDLPPVELVNFTRSLRVYALLGRHFLADLEQNNFAPDGEVISKPTITPANALTLVERFRDKPAKIYAAIEQFAAGRSVRRMLMDFRRAESAADQEAVEDEKRKRKKKEEPQTPGQMDFLHDMMKPLGEIDTLFTSREFLEKTDAKFWTSVADKLTAQAAKARQLAKEIA